MTDIKLPGSKKERRKARAAASRLRNPKPGSDEIKALDALIEQRRMDAIMSQIKSRPTNAELEQAA